MVPETEYSTSFHDLPLIHSISTPSSIITYIYSCPVILLPAILDQEKTSERTRPIPRRENTSSLLIPKVPFSLLIRRTYPLATYRENQSSRHYTGEMHICQGIIMHRGLTARTQSIAHALLPAKIFRSVSTYS